MLLKMKKWNQPRIILFNNTIISSGNPDDFLRGEFVFASQFWQFYEDWLEDATCNPFFNNGQSPNNSTGQNSMSLIAYNPNGEDVTIPHCVGS